MTVASIQLHNGDTIAVEIGNDDGTISQDEIDAAVRRLETEMGNHAGTEYIRHNARILISERGVTVERSADTFLRNGAVQLFGNNPMRTVSTGTFDDNPALWRPVAIEVAANGSRYTVYREVDRWDAVSGTMREGRTVRVNSSGGREVQVPPASADADPTWRWGTAADHIPRLTHLAASEVDGFSQDSLTRLDARGTGAGFAFTERVDSSATGGSGPRLSRDWIYDGPRTVEVVTYVNGERRAENVEFHYWHDPANPRTLVRSRTADPRHEPELNRSNGFGMWVCPGDSVLAPITSSYPAIGGTFTQHATSPAAGPLTIRVSGSATQTFTLTPLQRTVHVVDGQPVQFDEYTARSGGEPPVTTTLRRRSDGSGGWFTVNNGTATAIPASAIVPDAPPAEPPPARVGGGGRRSAPRPTGPARPNVVY